MNIFSVLVIARKELKDAMRNRWLALYASIFGTLSFSIAWLALSGTSSYGSIGFGRTAASLINMVILIVPLMGLTLGALSIAGERDKKTMLYLLAQPVSKFEIIIGKYLGLSLALIISLICGFGVSGIFITFKGEALQPTLYGAFILLTILLALVTLSFGFLISVIVQKSVTAISAALFTWLFLVLFTDLGLMGTALILNLGINELFVLTLSNPLQVYKITAILTLRSSLEVLGPGGIYATRTYGSFLLPGLLTLLSMSVVIPLGLCYAVLCVKKDLR
ncbi:MAG: ABC transporter permease subunit [SAR202 cluster bacterium]|jgi:Cu-processing system permease protein|nr:ABC transporter permease subunit [SAR202 cluster bacterium]HJO60013.1 ABC transporter permease subunit [SAR202 cluster bacterium]|tara:strand:- start:1668 stop:2501 length:834 start_codon:yes stop_codon:yes gene_type:complete